MSPGDLPCGDGSAGRICVETKAIGTRRERRMIQGLRTAIYRVADLERAREWYVGVLGSRPYFEESLYVGFDVGGFELGLRPPEPGGTLGGSGGVAYWGLRTPTRFSGGCWRWGSRRARQRSGRRRRDPGCHRAGPRRQRVRHHRKPALLLRHVARPRRTPDFCYASPILAQRRRWMGR